MYLAEKNQKSKKQFKWSPKMLEGVIKSVTEGRR